ncbi:6-carboxytetrahydropterin synthase QueD [Halothiobacillus sp.]|uniref:6-carboxytetrahydropterin synthase QueD n=1 Tax=Halothiobacillus sp. TaxID=1891311 RepID=UPI0026300F39|nr:6-carboxytetrahydropterin synthase QueD [Halothiobacillus sp.]MDD4966196.1 6-carboxytetrahydropterin synthase QueD [Halothiobacillus sp.]
MNTIASTAALEPIFDRVNNQLAAPNGQFCLTVTADFAAAHQLHGYEGNCARLHGHNWKIIVEVTGQKLDDVGMVIDFKAMKKAAREAAKTLDHQFLNQIEPFDRINPTAEHIAVWFFVELSRMLNQPYARVSAITVWENDYSAVTYRA